MNDQNPASSASEMLQKALQHQRAGNMNEAARLYQRLLDQDPRDVNALHLLGTIQLQRGAAREAVHYIRRALELHPRFAMAHANLGAAFRAAGDVQAAIESYRHALDLNPADSTTWLGLSIALAQIRQLDEALDASERALALRPDYLQAHRHRSQTLMELGRFEEALAGCERALGLDPRHATTHSQRGATLAELGRAEEALEALDRAVALAPEDPDILTNQATVLKNTGQTARARALYERVLREAPDHLLAHLGRVNLLIAEGQLPQARQAAEAGLATHAQSAEAYLAVAHAALASEQPLAALAACDLTLALRGGEPKALATRGRALLQLRRYEEALQAFEQALKLRPSDAALHLACAQILARGGRPEQALTAYRRARALNETLQMPEGSLLFMRMQSCDWSTRTEDAALARGGTGKPPLPPTVALGLFDDPALHLASATQWTKSLRADVPGGELASTPRGARSDVSPRRPLRLGYLSADFRDHVVTHALVRLLECHDRDAFALSALSLAGDDHSDARARLLGAMDDCLDLSALSDADAARAIRDHGIDVLIDLGGYSADARPGILLRRAAPLQVSYLGYPSTMGMDAVDYLIGDRFVIPAEFEGHYSERLVRLPDSFMPYDTTRAVAAAPPSRADEQLPEKALVLCSFNASWKIDPRTFDLWMRLLLQLPRSVLWVRGGEAVTDNLRREAAARGVSPERLVFARREPDPAVHLGRQRLADLFLDTWPYNAHQTACDALWTGLPVLTCAGRSFASRVAGSLLHAAGIPELVCATLEQYERRAIELASDRTQLQSLRARTLGARGSPLFDMPRLCRHLESAYLQMWRRHAHGEPPLTFDVERLQ